MIFRFTNETTVHGSMELPKPTIPCCGFICRLEHLHGLTRPPLWGLKGANRQMLKRFDLEVKVLRPGRQKRPGHREHTLPHLTLTNEMSSGV